MKKIISFIIAFSIVVPALAFAQTVSTSNTKTVVNAVQLSEILTLLEQELAFLEQEYNQLVAAQASTTQELAQIASSTSSSTLGQIESIVPTVTQTSTANHVQNNTNTQPTQQVVVSAPAPVQATSTTTPTNTSTQSSAIKLTSAELDFASGLWQFAGSAGCPTVSNAPTAANQKIIDNYLAIPSFTSVTVNGNIVPSTNGGLVVNAGDSVVITGNFLYAYCFQNPNPILLQDEIGLPPLTSPTTYSFTVPTDYGMAIQTFFGDIQVAVPAGLTANESGFVLHQASLLRTDDPTNCPAVTYATTTKNLANIDTYVTNEFKSSEITAITLNGAPAPIYLSSPGNYVVPGDTITLTGNFLYAYCTKQAVTASISDYKAATLSPMTSPTTYTFTIPSTDNGRAWSNVAPLVLTTSNDGIIADFYFKNGADSYATQ